MYTYIIIILADLFGYRALGRLVIHGVVLLQLVKLEVFVQGVHLVVGEVLAEELSQLVDDPLLVGLQLFEPDVLQVGVIKVLGAQLKYGGILGPF